MNLVIIRPIVKPIFLGFLRRQRAWIGKTYEAKSQRIMRLQIPRPLNRVVIKNQTPCWKEEAFLPKREKMKVEQSLHQQWQLHALI
jgi:hypothetical protein